MGGGFQEEGSGRKPAYSIQYYTPLQNTGCQKGLKAYMTMNEMACMNQSYIKTMKVKYEMT